MWVMIMLFVLTIGSSVQADTITLRTDAWCPYSCDPKSDHPGILAEIVEAAFARVGDDVDYQVTSWPRAIKEVRTGKANVLLGAYRGDAPDFVFHEQPAAISRMEFRKLPANDWEYEGLASLEGLSIGAIKDYSYGDSLDAYFAAHPEQMQMSFGKDPLVSLVRRLERGRVDVVIEESRVMAYFLKTHPEFTELVPAGGTDGHLIYVPLSPALPDLSRDLASVIDEGIEALRKSGELEKIYARYGVQGSSGN